ncbi:hypothetical protein COU58_01510 [Candidatus Pacearchaeota archaeon CG10_big_fil_rev_8_21_14_0_10_32_42]|nr:MAG: hypothetical protein COU58_01510 [Candidatus Pacearchaeota archaeon CG10_big_fil_rev_8_21_14_0_10_32_42]
MDVLLYATENPRNLGSIVRTSSCFGMDRIYLYDEFEILREVEKIKETSCGHYRESFIVPIGDPFEFTKKYSHKVAATLSKGSKRLWDPKYKIEISEDSLLIFGGETRGIPRHLSRPHDVEKIFIPVKDMDHCFSLPIAYALVVGEFFRRHPHRLSQRGK